MSAEAFYEAIWLGGDEVEEVWEDDGVRYVQMPARPKRHSTSLTTPRNLLKHGRVRNRGIRLVTGPKQLPDFDSTASHNVRVAGSGGFAHGPDAGGVSSLVSDFALLGSDLCERTGASHRLCSMFGSGSRRLAPSRSQE